MTSLRDTLDADEYDEFGLLRENAAEWDIPFTDQPVVSRESFTLPSGQELSYLRWDDGHVGRLRMDLGEIEPLSLEELEDARLTLEASADRIGRLMCDGLDIEDQLPCGSKAADLLLRCRTRILVSQRSPAPWQQLSL